MGLSKDREDEIIAEETLRANVRANIDSEMAAQQKKVMRWVVIIFMLGLLCSFIGKLPEIIRDWNSM